MKIKMKFIKEFEDFINIENDKEVPYIQDEDEFMPDGEDSEDEEILAEIKKYFNKE